METGTKPQVLFVDDEPYGTRSYREWLKRAGYDVIYAEEAAEALRLGDSGKFGVVIVDLMMPRPADMDLSDHDHGLETGAWLLAQMLSRPWSDSAVFIVLSVRNDALKKLAEAGVPPNRVIAYRKLEVSASELPQLVARALEDGGNPT